MNAMNSMNFEQRVQRIAHCRAAGLCFISLKPLDEPDKLATYSLDGAWLENVAVKAKYATQEVK